MRRAILLQVFHGIPEGDAMLFQKRMDPDTGTIPQQAPYLFLVEFARLIPCQRQAFQDMARHILPLRLDMLGNILWQMNSNFHTSLSRPVGHLSMYHSRKTHARQRREEPIAVRLKDYGPFSFISVMLRRQVTPRHPLIFSFWRAWSGSER